jgi:hypothetical protein
MLLVGIVNKEERSESFAEQVPLEDHDNDNNHLIPKDVPFAAKESRIDITPPKSAKDEKHVTISFRRIENGSTLGGRDMNLKQKFSKNSLSTTKYSWWNFIFKNLYEQFHRLANFFFLLTALLTVRKTSIKINNFPKLFS